MYRDLKEPSETEVGVRRTKITAVVGRWDERDRVIGEGMLR